MNHRLTLLAPIALAVLLAGCSVTVTMLGPLAPDSLVGYKLDLINEETGGPMDVDQLFDVKDEVAYHFLTDNEAVDFSLRNSKGEPAKSQKVSYKSSGDTGKLELTFRRSNEVDFIVKCTLTFEDALSGTHRCEFEDREHETIELNTLKSGWGEGTFELEKP